MKKTDCNQHELKAWELTVECYCDLVGGAENAQQDAPLDSDTFKILNEWFRHPEQMREEIYDAVIDEADRLHYAKHIRFAGASSLWHGSTQDSAATVISKSLPPVWEAPAQQSLTQSKIKTRRPKP